MSPTRRPESFWPLGAPSQLTSSSTVDVKTFVAPKSSSAFLISVGTTACRLTLDGSVPSATVGITVQPTSMPAVIPIAAAGDIKFVSASAAASVVDLLFLS